MSQMRRYCRDHAVLILDPPRAAGLGRPGLFDRWHQTLPAATSRRECTRQQSCERWPGRTGEGFSCSAEKACSPEI
jgi:hypothetical protein